MGVSWVSYGAGDQNFPDPCAFHKSLSYTYFLALLPMAAKFLVGGIKTGSKLSRLGPERDIADALVSFPLPEMH